MPAHFVRVRNLTGFSPVDPPYSDLQHLNRLNSVNDGKDELVTIEGYDINKKPVTAAEWFRLAVATGYVVRLNKVFRSRTGKPLVHQGIRSTYCEPILGDFIIVGPVRTLKATRRYRIPGNAKEEKNPKANTVEGACGKVPDSKGGRLALMGRVVESGITKTVRAGDVEVDLVFDRVEWLAWAERKKTEDVFEEVFCKLNSTYTNVTEERCSALAMRLGDGEKIDHVHSCMDIGGEALVRELNLPASRGCIELKDAGPIAPASSSGASSSSSASSSSAPKRVKSEIAATKADDAVSANKDPSPRIIKRKRKRSDDVHDRDHDDDDDADDDNSSPNCR